LFVEKLNKKQEGIYVIEEEKTIVDGKWEGYLDHDNVNRESIVIYTGPGFTGEKVDNFFISTPSEAPWKTYLKVFSNSEKFYITYESQGDQVEAEDINLLQNTLVDEINRAKTEEKRIEERLNDEITRAITEDERLDVEVNKKANKTYVDTELNKRYTKDEVFNKQEVLQKIQDLIGTAPEALDTLAEIADALNNDPDFAATVTNLLSQKVDKVTGKGLSTEDYTTAEKQKLAGIEEGANKYIHPSAHPASMIVESTYRRFVSDTEKDSWNAKETPAGAQQKADIAEQNAKAYTDAHEQKAAPHSGHETPTGAQAKVDAHANRTDNPHSVTKSQVGLGNIENYEVATQKEAEEGTATNKYMTPQRTKQAIDSLQAVKSVAGKTGTVTLSKSDVGLSNVDNVQQASKAEFDSHNQDFTRHITEEERTTWNNKTNLTLGETSSTAYRGDRGKIAYDHSQSLHAPPDAQKNSDITKAEIEAKLVGDITSHYHSQYVTHNELGSAGYGDMMKSVYDKDNDGKVDAAKAADSVSWDGVTGKPSTFPPSSHAHSEYTKRIVLTGQCQKSSYCRSVIALIDVTNTNPNANSNTQGIITFHRPNGYVGNVMALVNMEKRYNTEQVSYSGLTIGYNAANIRPCTFTYNGVKYGGIEVYISDSELSIIEFNGVTNFNIFGLDYYDTRGTVLNSEVNDSLNFDDVYWINTFRFNGNGYYTQDEIDSKLTGKSNTGHIHDDRYYTESEIDTKLSGKANISHTHTISNITGLQTVLDEKMPKGPLTWNDLKGV